MKVAVIGCGTIANTAHIPAYMENEKAEIKYFCDIIPERAEAAVEKYGCGIAITDYKVALADPEIEAISVFHLIRFIRLSQLMRCAPAKTFFVKNLPLVHIPKRSRCKRFSTKQARC